MGVCAANSVVHFHILSTIGKDIVNKCDSSYMTHLALDMMQSFTCRLRCHLRWESKRKIITNCVVTYPSWLTKSMLENIKEGLSWSKFEIRDCGMPDNSREPKFGLELITKTMLAISYPKAIRVACFVELQINLSQVAPSFSFPFLPGIKITDDEWIYPFRIRLLLMRLSVEFFEQSWMYRRLKDLDVSTNIWSLVLTMPNMATTVSMVVTGSIRSGSIGSWLKILLNRHSSNMHCTFAKNLYWLKD